MKLGLPVWTVVPGRLQEVEEREMQIEVVEGTVTVWVSVSFIKCLNVCYATNLILDVHLCSTYFERYYKYLMIAVSV